MLNINRKVRLPSSFYINNGRLAEKIMRLISARDGELPDLTIQNIKEIALEHDQEFMGEPTFAKALVELIEKINTNPNNKLNLILDTAKITLHLKNLITG